MAGKGNSTKEELNPDPLCCCEYINVEGERSHILAVCCDCEAIDDTFDRWIKRAAIPDSNYTRIWSTVADRMRVPWFGGARRCSWELTFPVVAVPLLMLISTFNELTLFFSLSCLPLIIFLSRTVLRHQTKTHFYYIWTCSSFFTLLYVFELHVIPMLMISFYEHLVFAILLSMALLCWYRVRTRPGFCPQQADSAGAAADYCERCVSPRPPRAFHCSACERCVRLRDHHCVWLDCCVGGANRRPFVAGLACVSLALLQAGWLTIATICDEVATISSLLLLPVTCRQATVSGSVALFGALYALAAAGLCAALLAHQCFLVSLGQTGCERRRRLTPPDAGGLLRNWSRFISGGEEQDSVREADQQRHRPAGLEGGLLPARSSDGE